MPAPFFCQAQNRNKSRTNPVQKLYRICTEEQEPAIIQ